MKNNLTFHNPRFITYGDKQFTIDVLGGVDVQQIERMICTLRITYRHYPPFRTTLDLYSDPQTDKLIRTLCDKWGIALTESSGSVHSLITQLESYKLDRLKYPQQKSGDDFEQSDEEAAASRRFLHHKNLVKNVQMDLQQMGIFGEPENALILFLSMASHKFSNPFSVICLAKSGAGKSYLLRKLSECMPETQLSYHTQISENALYYFDSHQIDGKVLFIEDLEWTSKMLIPLSTLQTSGRLVKTRATKDKDGMLHTHSFDLEGKLCLIACAYADKGYDKLSLPFLCLHLNHSAAQDMKIMDYQRSASAGLIDKAAIKQTQRKLKCVISTLQNVSVINPYAPLIALPEELPEPRKTLLLLLNFIDIITYFHQYQRKTVTDEETGEQFTLTDPADIELAFSLLKGSLLRRADELSTTARDFYNWLKNYLSEAQTDRFTALDIRKAKRVHPRTLNNYLNDLKLYSYVQVVGGNKHREGYIYQLTHLNEQAKLQSGIESSLKTTLDKIYEAHGQHHADKQEPPQPINRPVPESKQVRQSEKNAGVLDKDSRRKRINEKENYTLKLLLEQEAEQPGREYLPVDLTMLSGRSKGIEARYLKRLWEQGKLDRKWRERQYFYTLRQPQGSELATTSSRQVSQSPLSDPETLTMQEKDSRKNKATKGRE